jgi:hypothetical protein
MSERGLRFAVAGVDVFEAASAIVGAVGLVVGFMDIPVRGLAGTPFTDFTVPALLLGVVVGGSALVAAVLTAFGPPRVGAVASAAAGGITVGWMTIEIAMLGLVHPAQVVYFLVGLLMIGLAALLWRGESPAAAAGFRPRPV